MSKFPETIINVTEMFINGLNVMCYNYPCDNMETAKELMKRIKDSVNVNPKLLDGVFMGQVKATEPKEGVLRYDSDTSLVLIKDNFEYKLGIFEDSTVSMDNIDDFV